ncbi:CSC1-like protein ERD4 [Fagus crenata]
MTQMDFSSFLTSLGTSFLIFVVLMLLFSWLSSKPGNAVIYYPNRILKGLDPFEGGSRTRNPFSWIREAMSSTEQDVISISGYDTAVYFVFLSTVLLPVAATDDNGKSAATTSNGTFSDMKSYPWEMLNRRILKWAFLLALYWVSFVTYYLLWKAYKHVSGLMRSEQFAILVRDIPPVPEGQTRKDQVDSYFKTIHPETFYRSMVIQTTKRIWKELEGYKKKLARAEAIYAVKNNWQNQKEQGPLTKLASLVAAAAAAQSLHAHIVDKWTVTDAPEPRQIIWSNLKIKFFRGNYGNIVFVGYGLQLSRLVPLIIYHLKRKYICKTEAELKEAWFPGDLGYGTRVLALKVHVPATKAMEGCATHAYTHPSISDTIPTLEVACRELKEAPNMEQISELVPNLSSEKIDDEDYEDALSQVSRSGSFV